METKGCGISKKMSFSRASITSTWILQTKACMYVMMASLANSGPALKDTSTSEAKHPERAEHSTANVTLLQKKTAIKMKMKASGPTDQDSRAPETAGERAEGSLATRQDGPG